MTIAFFAICLAALLAAGITMYSGFGLGTVLLPVFALFFPVEAAVAATALVHGANNVFKVALLGRDADLEVVARFGIPAVAGAVLGALALGYLSQAGSRVSVNVDDYELIAITPIKLVVGLLMIGFALFELLPRFRRLEFDRRWLPLGGALSGFFGGLSGHQGALRSAFLSKAGLHTAAFVATNAVIGFLVDLMRITVYAGLFVTAGEHLAGFEAWPLVIAGSLSAFAGVLIGRRYLHRVEIRSVQVLVGIFLLGMGGALMLGFI